MSGLNLTVAWSTAYRPLEYVQGLICDYGIMRWVMSVSNGTKLMSA